MDKRTCSIDACDGPVNSRGWCKRHYERWRIHGDPLVNLRPGGVCSVADCRRPSESRGWCGLHYKRWQVHGDPLMTTWHQPKLPCAIEGCENLAKTLGWCGMHYERWRRFGSTDDRLKGNRDRIYTLNEHYFDVIDTPDKAYWLGFIAGDGYVREDRGLLAVRLAEIDAGHLRKLRAALGSSSPLRHYASTVGKKPGTPYAGLFICSMPLATALAAHGVVQAKSLILQPWAGPPDLMPHYWRGLVDADGTVMAVRNQWQVSLVGSRAVVHGFADWVRSVNPETGARPRRVGNIWIFAAGGRVRCRRIAEALYGDCSTALERKRARAEVLIAAGPSRRVGHENSPEARLKISATKRQRHAERKARELEGTLF